MFMRRVCVELSRVYLDDESIQLLLCDSSVRNPRNRVGENVQCKLRQGNVELCGSPRIHVLNAAKELVLITVNHTIRSHNFPLGSTPRTDFRTPCSGEQREFLHPISRLNSLGVIPAFGDPWKGIRCTCNNIGSNTCQRRPCPYHSECPPVMYSLISPEVLLSPAY